MTLKTIYLLRHGFRSNWLPEPHPESPTGIEADVILAEHGLEQAEELAEYFKTNEDLVKPQLIVTSPFVRCIETIRPLSKALDLEIIIERCLGEWFKKDRALEKTIIDGKEELTVPLPANLDVLQRVFAQDNLKMNKYWNTYTPNIKGETQQEIQERAIKGLPSLIKRIEEEYPDVEHVLLCTHAATKIAFGMALLGYDSLTEPLRDVMDGQPNIIRAGSCSLDKFITPPILHEKPLDLFERDWIMTMNGNTTFLTNGEEMHWDFSNGFEAGSDADIKYRQEMAKLEKQHGVQMDKSSTDGEHKKKTKKDKDNVDDSYEEHLVEINLPQNFARSFAELPKDDGPVDFQIAGVNTENPIVKVGKKFYEGEWQKPIGSTIVSIPNDDENKSKNDMSNMKQVEASIDLQELKVKK
ncbi:hypothetical protein ACO0R3_004118 [Hanseniaspora guilliermondii]